MKFRKFILYSSILLVLLFSITAISAADLNDTACTDDKVLKLDPDDTGSFVDLYSESKSAGQTFNIETNYKFNNTTDFAYTSGVDIDRKYFVINGNNFEIDCDHQAKNGLAKFTIKKNVIKKLKAGKKYTMKVTYLKNTVKTTLSVKRR